MAVFAVAGLLVRTERLNAVAAEEREDAARARAESEIEKAAAATCQLVVRDRQLQMSEFERKRLSPRTARWRDELWLLGTKLSGGGKEPDLRDGMAALLSGLDATPVREFREGAASFLAFARLDERKRALDASYCKRPTRPKRCACTAKSWPYPGSSAPPRSSGAGYRTRQRRSRNGGPRSTRAAPLISPGPVHSDASPGTGTARPGTRANFVSSRLN